QAPDRRRLRGLHPGEPAGHRPRSGTAPRHLRYARLSATAARREGGGRSHPLRSRFERGRGTFVFALHMSAFGQRRHGLLQWDSRAIDVQSTHAFGSSACWSTAHWSCCILPTLVLSVTLWASSCGPRFYFTPVCPSFSPRLAGHRGIKRKATSAFDL